MELSAEMKKKVLAWQRDEVNSSLVYASLAQHEKHAENKTILEGMAADEAEHAAVWKSYSGVSLKPSRFTVWWQTVVGRLMGYTFLLKFLQNKETLAGAEYEKVVSTFPQAAEIMQAEHSHESALIDMLDEERLHYIGAMVLGLNDALVELTGTIAGLTFAFADNRLVALSGIITGTSATLSMAASNYLAERADGNPHALKSSVYTGITYLVTVVLLVLPYLLLPSDAYIAALVVMLGVVLLAIVFFNYYISVAKSQKFLSRFAEMAGISLSVAAIAFVIGLLVKKFLGIDV